MAEAISTILPQAFGAAISPIPIIAVILMLFTSNARVNAPAFAFGWILALLTVVTVAFIASDSQNVGSDEGASTGASLVRLILAGLLLLLSVKQWKSRPKPGDEAKEAPAWMTSIESFTPVKAFGMGALLAGPNPKNLLLAIAAGTSIAQTGASGSSAVVAIIAFALIGTVSVAGPVIYYFAAGDRAEKSLNVIREWLAANNSTVMCVLFLILGISMLSDALTALLN